MNLDKNKLENMIREYRKIDDPTKDEIIQFNILLKTWENTPDVEAPPLLHPPNTIITTTTITTIGKPPNINIILDDRPISLKNLIKDIKTDAFFIRRKERCEKYEQIEAINFKFI